LREHSLVDGLYGLAPLSFDRPERVAELQLQNF
jgi:hypothetical protein